MKAAIELGCEACPDTEGTGLGLCSRHLDQWLRSVERRKVTGMSDEKWNEAMEAFVERVREGVQ